MTPKNCVCDNISWEIKGNYAREIRLQPAARYNQWFDTVSTNLGTSLGFDHNNEKMCVSSLSPHLFFRKLFYWKAMSLSLARLDSGRRKSSRWTPWNLCQMFFKKTLSTLDLHAENKGKFRTVFQNILFISQFMNCFIAARGKRKIETTGVSVKWIPIFSTRSL